MRWEKSVPSNLFLINNSKSYI